MSTEQERALRQQFQQGVELAQRGRRAQALQLFTGCLTLAAEQQQELSLEQLAAILQEIAWCHGDMGHWEEARRCYDQIERLLTRAPGWREAVPAGVALRESVDFDPAPMLAALYESLGIAYDNVGDAAQAQSYYQRAIKSYSALGNLQKVATVWHHVALGCQRRADWPGLQQAGERMLALWTQLQVAYGQVWAWQYLAQAHAQQGNLAQAVAVMVQAVAVERQLRHRDLARDEAILADLQRAYARTPRGLLRRLLRSLR